MGIFSSKPKLSMADIEGHESYTVIAGKIYDTKGFKHPGGAANLAKVIGKDGTEVFTEKHPLSYVMKLKLVGRLKG
jgi:cytochrome b involved in lipid metabolism